MSRAPADRGPSQPPAPGRAGSLSAHHPLPAPRAACLRATHRQAWLGPWRLAGVLALGLAAPLWAEVSFTSPGLPPTRMDDQGRLVEDWGAVAFKLTGAGLPAAPPPAVQSVKLDGIIPGAQARAQYGPVAVTVTAFRAPAWPAGLDVLNVRVSETAGQQTSAQLSLLLPETVHLGLKTVTLGGRAVVGLPTGIKVSQAMREWGWADDALAMPGWATPAVECDPAFRNIRAGMGGVPILYRFKVEPKARLELVLGFCESYWAQAGQRPLVCRVEGAPPQELDPVARWGQHQPGALLFAARDENGDGLLDVAVLPKLGAPDQNPILNVIWLFPADTQPNLEQTIAGRLNGVALRYVDVGGSNDQSLYAGGQAEYVFNLPPGATEELTFLVACPGASVPLPDRAAWTPEKLRQSAAQVWRQWQAR